MKRFLIIAAVFVSQLGFSETKIDRFIGHANTFFGKYVSQGLVDYQSLHQDPTALNGLVKEIEGIHVNGSKNNTNLAFYINAYNVLVISNVIAHYPIASPLDVDGFFDKIKHRIGNESLTLNDIENVKIRAVYKDPRIHFVLVCAAQGCPKIVDYAYTASKLNQQLDNRTKIAINDASFTRIKSASKMLLLSEIFKWYKEDFISGDKTLRTYVNAYLSREKQVPENYTVDFYPYNWKLNAK